MEEWSYFSNFTYRWQQSICGVVRWSRWWSRGVLWHFSSRRHLVMELSQTHTHLPSLLLFPLPLPPLCTVAPDGRWTALHWAQTWTSRTYIWRNFIRDLRTRKNIINCLQRFPFSLLLWKALHLNIYIFFNVQQWKRKNVLEIYFMYIFSLSNLSESSYE